MKNNLQIISSLLALQSDNTPTAAGRALLEESVFRVRSMALIHEQLYSAESLERIDLGAYARRLVEALGAALAPGAQIEISAVPTEVNVEVAVPVGLILNELLTNAFKYGLPADGRDAAEGPDVRLEITSEGDTVRLAVSDRGAGLPAGFHEGAPTTLGLQLVRSLVRQLRGNLTARSDRGARFELTFRRRARY